MDKELRILMLEDVADEFVVLSIESRIASAQTLSNRLQENLESHNAKGGRSFKLSISMGIVYYDPEFPCSIDELITKADRLMYEQKRNKQTDLRNGRG
jgi:diguanylate cyclase (GGDEF)-like protein